MKQKKWLREERLRRKVKEKRMGKNDYVGDDGVSCSGETLGKIWELYKET